MSKPVERIEIVTSVQRHRRYTAEEKVRLVEQIMQPGMTVTAVARLHGVSPSLLFQWRRRMAKGRHKAVKVDEMMVPANRARELGHRIRELERHDQRHRVRVARGLGPVELASGARRRSPSSLERPDIVNLSRSRASVRNYARFQCVSASHRRTAKGLCALRLQNLIEKSIKSTAPSGHKRAGSIPPGRLEGGPCQLSDDAVRLQPALGLEACDRYLCARPEVSVDSHGEL